MIREEEICNCDCDIHGGQSVHNEPCCEPCVGCRKNIAKGHMESHKRHCEPYQQQKRIDQRLAQSYEPVVDR